MRYEFTGDEIALIDTLRQAQYMANAIDQHASEWDGTYGAIKTATLKALETAFEARGMNFINAKVAAELVYDAMIDSGENAGYCLNLWREGKLDDDYEHVAEMVSRVVATRAA